MTGTYPYGGYQPVEAPHPFGKILDAETLLRYRYAYINDPQIRENIGFLNEKFEGEGYSLLTPEEIWAFNSLYNQGQYDRLWDYMDEKEMEFAKRRQENHIWETEEFARQNPGLASLRSFWEKLENIFWTPYQAAVMAEDPEMAKYSPAFDSYYEANALRGNRAEAWEEALPGWGSWLYNTLMSVGDGVLERGLDAVAPGLGVAMSGMGVAGETLADGAQRDLSLWQAAPQAGLNAALNMASDKLEFKALKGSTKEASQYLVKNAADNAIGATVEEIGRTGADLLFSGDKAHLAQAYRDFLAAGDTQAQALIKTVGAFAGDTLQSVAQDVAAGEVLPLARVGYDKGKALYLDKRQELAPGDYRKTAAQMNPNAPDNAPYRAVLENWQGLNAKRSQLEQQLADAVANRAPQRQITLLRGKLQVAQASLRKQEKSPLFAQALQKGVAEQEDLSRSIDQKRQTIYDVDKNSEQIRMVLPYIDQYHRWQNAMKQAKAGLVGQTDPKIISKRQKESHHAEMKLAKMEERPIHEQIVETVRDPTRANLGSKENPVNIRLRMGQDWTDREKEAALKKAALLTAAETVKTRPEARNRAARDLFVKLYGPVPPGFEVDHKVDLQLGGLDHIRNLQYLPIRINRSIGPQIRWRTEDVEYGTYLGTFDFGQGGR